MAAADLMQLISLNHYFFVCSRDAAEIVSNHHPMGTVFASPRWLTMSWKEKRLLPTSAYRPRSPPVEVSKPATKEMEKKMASSALLPPEKKIISSLFKGSLFALIRLAPPDGAVDFDFGELTTDFVSNGGQMLTSKIIEALRTDKKGRDATRRNCYVVFWGGYTPTHLAIHPLVSQVQKEDLCRIVLVTPIWLRASIADGKVISVSRQKLLFHPQAWPLQKLPPHLLKISITGFVKPERTAIYQLINAIGATSTENLSRDNTHLICREAKGPKYEKAQVWRLHVVTVDWIYHIARFGYGGESSSGDNLKVGCEDKFQFGNDQSGEGANDDNDEVVEGSQEMIETQFVS